MNENEAVVIDMSSMFQVHSIAASILLGKDAVHFFDDIGYQHDSFMHCPKARELQKKCHCDSEETFGMTRVFFYCFR